MSLLRQLDTSKYFDSAIGQTVAILSLCRLTHTTPPLQFFVSNRHLVAGRRLLRRRPVTTFALIATILLTLSASVASVTAAPVQDFGFFTAGQFPLYVTNPIGKVVHQIDASGTASTYATGFNDPLGLAFDASGNLYVGDRNDKVVYLVPPGGGAVGGAVSTYATGFDEPRGLAFDASGNLYVADRDDNVVYLVPPGGGAVGGAVSTYATGFNNNLVGHLAC